MSNLIRIVDNDDWVVNYDKKTKKYIVAYFEDFHFIDDIRFIQKSLLKDVNKNYIL